MKRATDEGLVQGYRIELLFGGLFKGLSFLMSFLIVRTLGMGLFGEFLLCTSLAAFLSTLMRLGCAGALKVTLPEAKEEPGAFERTFHAALQAVCLGIVAVTPIVWILSDSISTFLNLPNLDDSLWVLVWLLAVVRSFTNPMIVQRRVLLENLQINLSITTDSASRFVGILVIFLLDAMTIRSLLWVGLVAETLQLLVLYRHRFDFLARTFTGFHLRHHRWVFPLKIYCFNLINFSISSKGLGFYIQLLMGPAYVTLFTLVEQLYEQAYQLVAPRSMGVMLTANLVEKEGGWKNGRNLMVYTRFSTMTRLLILVGLVSFCSLLFSWYGVNTEGKETFILVYGLCFWVLGLQEIPEKFFTIEKRVEWLQISRILTLLLILSSAPWLFGTIGLHAAPLLILGNLVFPWFFLALLGLRRLPPWEGIYPWSLAVDVAILIVLFLTLAWPFAGALALPLFLLYDRIIPPLRTVRRKLLQGLFPQGEGT